MKPQQTFLLIGSAFLIAVVACIYFIDQAADQKMPFTAKDTNSFQWNPTVEVDVPGTEKYPDPTFIVYLDDEGKAFYEIVGKQASQELSIDQLYALLKKHQAAEKKVAVEVRPTPRADYKILREYMAVIGEARIKNYRLVGIE